MSINENSRLHQQETYCSSSALEICDCGHLSKLEKRLAFALSFALALVLLLIVVLIERKGERITVPKNENMCLSSTCISTSADILRSMNMSVEPCDDFYSFVCGGWEGHVATDGPITSQFTRLQNTLTLRLKETLQTKEVNMSKHEEKTKNFFDSCMNLEDRDSHVLSELQNDLESFGGWPLLLGGDAKASNWTDLMAGLFRAGYPAQMLMSLSVDPDPRNSSASVISIDQPSLGLRERLPYILKVDKALQRYRTLILNLAKRLNSSLAEEKALAEINRAIDIEKQFAKVVEDSVQKDHLEDYENFKTLNEIKLSFPKIPWRDLLTKLLPESGELKDDTPFMVARPKALDTLHEILGNSENDQGKRDLANYMLYRSVLFAARHLDSDLLRMCEAGTPQRHSRDLWETCLEETVVYFHLSLTSTYARKRVDPADKIGVEKMLESIHIALQGDIQDSHWLDKETKERALLKVKRLISTVGYNEEMLDESKMDEYYADIEVEDNYFRNVKSANLHLSRRSMQGLNELNVRSRWSDTKYLLTSNAFYRVWQNSITIPVGMLQDTFFSSKRPRYMNYGGLGAILGHEHTHAFDSIGSKYDEEGNFDMWWTNKSWNNFQSKTKCYIDQYNQYYEPRVELHINGTRTLSENMADSGGVLTAYRAYSELLKSLGSEQQLPGLHFTEKQMFWIAFSSVWCRKQTDRSLERTIESSVHAPSKFRVMGSLSNSKEFSEDFNCKEPSDMNPSSKCSLWK